tara:strand:+ start:1109 stop:2545 length:1437 start_codon:yes stop_codon:yes gene_type:complete
MTKARDIADFKFENITDTGTEGTKVASGTTAQRGSTTGQWRFNSTTGFFEGINATGGISSLEPDPTITSVDDGEVDSAAGGNQTIVITGTNFASGGTVTFVGSSAEFDATTTTYNSTTQVTAVAPKASFLNAQEPYKVKFTSATGKSGISSVGLINVDNLPTWTTSAGSIGNVEEGATSTLSVAATDTDGDTVSYSVQSGSLPTGLTLNSSTGAIQGTAPAVTGDTTFSFTLRATAGGKTADRAFTMVVTEFVYDGSTQARAAQYGSEVITRQGSNFSAGRYWLTGKSSLGLTAQQVYIDADGYMLVYRHAGTNNSFNSTYEITGDALGEAAVGTLYSPTQGLTDTGSSTTAGSRGMARLSAEFCNALGGDSASGQVTRMTVGSRTDFITDAKIWWTAASGDGYGHETISCGNSYANRRSATNASPESDRPIGTYNAFGGSSGTGGIIPFYHGSNYSGGYNSDNTSWHNATTIWVRQY